MRKFILGTDWGEDCDDAVALRILCRYHKKKEIELLGIGINTCDKNSAPSVYGFLNKEGVEGVAVGVDRSAEYLNIEARYQPRLAAYAPNKTNNDAEDAVKMYRRILAEADGKVDIMEIGFLQVLAGVLTSGADGVSDKTGIELVKEKVDRVWIMGGKWNEQGGREYNFSRHPDACLAASEVCSKCPVPITFLGWEIGSKLITGDKLDKNDFLYDVLCDHGCPNGRESWDPMLVLMAIIGDEKKAGYSTVCADVCVNPDTGANFFDTKNIDGQKPSRRFVVKDCPDSYYSDMINEIIK